MDEHTMERVNHIAHEDATRDHPPPLDATRRISSRKVIFAPARVPTHLTNLEKN